MSERHKIVGLKYYEQNFLPLGKKNPDYDLTKKELIAKEIDGPVYEYEFKFSSVQLVPDPDNEHDPNAVKVLLDGVHVGFVKKGSCSHVKKLLNEPMRVNRFRYGRYKEVYLEEEEIDNDFCDGICEIIIGEDEKPKTKIETIAQSEEFKKQTSASKPFMIIACIVLVLTFIYLFFGG